MQLQQIKISDIKIADNRRDLGDIRALADSIQEIGLINPILVTKDFKLIAGNHRLRAFELLGFDTIPATVIDCEVLQSELMEIDENLIRNNFTPLQESLALSRRKEIYLQLHPETKNGGDRKSDKAKNQNEKISFCSDTAAKTGKNKRTVEMKVSVGDTLKNNPEIVKKIEAIEANTGEALTQKALSEIVKIDNANKQDQVLNLLADNNAKNVKAALHMLNIAEQKEKIENGNIEMPSGLFDVISLDPPWKYEVGEANSYDSDGRRVANPYPEMDVEQIRLLKLPVKDDAVMWLWTTHKYLNTSFDLLESWGFEYKSTLVWDKDAMGMGYWLRMQCEFCLLAIKGKPVWSNTEIRDILREKRREHSRKPEGFYELVEKVCVGRKLDFFSRETRVGWESFGNDKELFNGK